MATPSVQELEQLLGWAFSADYRSFLATNTDKLLEPPLTFEIPGDEPPFGRSISLHILLTARDIRENSRREMIGVPERSMMIMGGTLMGGYLYMCLSSSERGAIYFRAPYVSGEFFRVSGNFQQFQSTVPRAREHGCLTTPSTRTSTRTRLGVFVRCFVLRSAHWDDLGCLTTIRK
jgi:hypothetical protein